MKPILRVVKRGEIAVGRRAAAVGSRPAPRCSTHRRKTESRRPSSLATEEIERPLEATCAYRKSNPGILVVQPAQNRATENASNCLGGA